MASESPSLERGSTFAEDVRGGPTRQGHRDPRQQRRSSFGAPTPGLCPARGLGEARQARGSKKPPRVWSPSRSSTRSFTASLPSGMVPRQKIRDVRIWRGTSPFQWSVSKRFTKIIMSPSPHLGSTVDHVGDQDDGGRASNDLPADDTSPWRFVQRAMSRKTVGVKSKALRPSAGVARLFHAYCVHR